jgi:Mn-dependent DtxR family transcriptional regulator
LYALYIIIETEKTHRADAVLAPLPLVRPRKRYRVPRKKKDTNSWFFFTKNCIVIGMYESGENYLETILMLHSEVDFVRSVDVARRLNVSRPSVSRAMGLLKQDGYIDIEENGAIHLTSKGMKAADKIYTKHRRLTAFLELTTGVPHEQAEENACRIEHIIDEDVFEGILRFMQAKTATTV